MVCGCLALAAAVWVSRYSPWAVFREQRARADEELAWQERKKTLQVFADDLKERDEKKGVRNQKIGIGR